MRLRKKIHLIVEANKGTDRLSRFFDIFMVCLIFLNVAAVVLETVDAIAAVYGDFFKLFEIFSVLVFTVEYLMRIWSCVDDGHQRTPIIGRIRFMLHPMLIIDLIAILPFFLFMFISVDLRSLRILRVLRILKLTRYSGAAGTLMRVFSNEKGPLFTACTIMFTLLIFLSSIMYLIENGAQPEKFGNIPSAMWWGMATLTTVGYGDVYPVTPLGQVVGAFVTLIGLGMFALPAAILANGFSKETERTGFLVTWNLIAKLPLFEDLPARHIADIAALLTPLVAVPGEIIITKGSVGENMFFIVNGSVCANTGQHEIFLQKDDFFGEMALILDQPRSANVVAQTSCELLVLERDDYKRMLSYSPELQQKLAEKAEQRMQS